MAVIAASTTTRHTRGYAVRPAWRTPRLGVLVLLVALAGGCSSTAVVLHGDIPSGAAIEPLPLTLGVYYPPELSGHVHEESIPNYGDWTIEAGAAHLQMWQRLLPSMFTRVITLNSTTAPASGAELILSPNIDEFQFSIPAQTKNTFYEVWIRYQIGVYTPTGEMLAQFPHVAYGKSRSKTFSSDTDGIDEAAYWAFRDAGAFFARDFARNPQLRDWLDERLNPPVEYDL